MSDPAIKLTAAAVLCVAGIVLLFLPRQKRGFNQYRQTAVLLFAIAAFEAGLGFGLYDLGDGLFR